MMRVHITQRSSLCFRFLAISFFLFLVIAVTHVGLITYAEQLIVLIPSDEKSLLVTAVEAKVRPPIATLLTRVLALNVEPRSLVAVGGFQNFDINADIRQHQIYNLVDFWDFLRPSVDQPTLQSTIQRKNAQSTVWLQNSSLPKALS